MQRDVVLWTSSKLTGSWSAEAIVDDLDEDLINQLCALFFELEALVRVRLLISCCLLSSTKRKELQGPINDLLRTACKDENEWVRFYGHAISSDEGDVSLQRALGAFPEIHATINSVSAKLEDPTHVATPRSMRPLEEAFLSVRLTAERGAPPIENNSSEHFTRNPVGHDQSLILLGTRVGFSKAVYDSAVSTSEYAPLFSGAGGASSARQPKKREAPAPMLVKSTVSHFKSAQELEALSPRALALASKTPFGSATGPPTKRHAAVPGAAPPATSAFPHPEPPAAAPSHPSAATAPDPAPAPSGVADALGASAAGVAQVLGELFEGNDDDDEDEDEGEESGAEEDDGDELAPNKF